MKHLGYDCPRAVFLQQRKLIGEATAEPTCDLDPRSSNGVREINVDDFGLQIRGGRVFGDPVEQDLDRSSKQTATNIPEYE